MSFTISKTFFKKAIRFAEDKHGYDLDEDYLRSLILKIADKKNRMSFEEALRFSLNELYLYDGPDKPSRKIYKCGAAKYYSSVSGAARKARSKSKKKGNPKNKRKKRAPVLKEGKDGQYAFNI